MSILGTRISLNRIICWSKCQIFFAEYCQNIVSTMNSLALLRSLFFDFSCGQIAVAFVYITWDHFAGAWGIMHFINHTGLIIKKYELVCTSPDLKYYLAWIMLYALHKYEPYSVSTFTFNSLFRNQFGATVLNIPRGYSQAGNIWGSG